MQNSFYDQMVGKWFRIWLQGEPLWLHHFENPSVRRKPDVTGKCLAVEGFELNRYIVFDGSPPNWLIVPERQILYLETANELA